MTALYKILPDTLTDKVLDRIVARIVTKSESLIGAATSENILAQTFGPQYHPVSKTGHIIGTVIVILRHLHLSNPYGIEDGCKVLNLRARQRITQDGTGIVLSSPSDYCKAARTS